MNLPPDKVKILSQYDNEKKWDLICDQVGLWNKLWPRNKFIRTMNNDNEK